MTYSCRFRHKLRGARARQTLTILLMLTSAGCSSSLQSGAPHRAYALFTDAGPVLIDVDGFAHGFTHSALEAWVRKGLTQADRGQLRLLQPEEGMPRWQMLLHIEEGFRPARAQVTLELFHAGKLVESASTAAPAAGAFPAAVFIHTVADLARRLLPHVGPNFTTMTLLTSAT